LSGDHVGTLVGTDTGFVLVDRNEEQIRALIAESEETLAWIKQHAKPLPRPITALSLPQTPEHRVREMVGAPSVDAVDLTSIAGRLLFADDLGLRKLHNSEGKDSFSTVSFVSAAAALGKIDGEGRERIYAGMLRRRFVSLRLSPEMLASLMLHEEVHGRDVTERALLSLVLPGGDLQSASSAAVGVLKIIATSRIRSIEIPSVAMRILETLATRWARRAVAIAVEREAGTQLALLPDQLQLVQQVCRTFLTSGIPIIGS